MAEYQHPGVYIEEISKLPPSITSVETAIPAFIGYTQKAQLKGPGDLVRQPWRITSMLEYVLYFGGPQPETTITVTIDKTQPNKVDVQGSVATPSNTYVLFTANVFY